MPVTPFHFGPGGLISVASRGRVSFLSFCASNVLIDVESLANMLANRPRIHTFLHTYIGATLAASVVIAGFWVLGRMMRTFGDQLHSVWAPRSTSAVTLGALLGAWSHVLLDSVMHSDITPWAPFSDANGFYRVVSLGTLHQGCFGAAIVAAACWLLAQWRSKRRDNA